MGSNSHHSRAIARLGQAQDCSLQARLRPAFGGHPGLDDGVLPEQVERHAPQQAQIARGMAGSHPVLVSPKGQV